MNMKIIGLLFLLVALFAGSSLYAQGEQPVDTNRHKAQELENFAEYLKAAEIYEKSVQAEKDSPESIKSNIVTGLNQAAYYYSLAGQYKTATNKIEEALKIAGKLDRDDLVADCLNRFGYFYNYLKRHDVAIKYYMEALDIYRKLGQEGNVATSESASSIKRTSGLSLISANCFKSEVSLDSGLIFLPSVLYHSPISLLFR